jgi:hypothetical protein
VRRTETQIEEKEWEEDVRDECSLGIGTITLPFIAFVVVHAEKNGDVGGG